MEKSKSMEYLSLNLKEIKKIHRDGWIRNVNRLGVVLTHSTYLDNGTFPRFSVDIKKIERDYNNAALAKTPKCF